MNQDGSSPKNIKGKDSSGTRRTGPELVTNKKGGLKEWRTKTANHF